MNADHHVVEQTAIANNVVKEEGNSSVKILDTQSVDQGKNSSVLRQRKMTDKFFEWVDDFGKFPENLSIELFDGDVFEASQQQNKIVNSDFSVWRGSSHHNQAYQDIVAVSNKRTGKFMISLIHKGKKYTIQPNNVDEYILRELKPGNPD